jgi:hypothetical protein
MFAPNEKPPLRVRGGGRFAGRDVLQIGGPQPKIRSSTPTIRITGATTPTPTTGDTTKDREAPTASFVVSIIDSYGRGVAALRQVMMMLRVKNSHVGIRLIYMKSCAVPTLKKIN